MRTPEETAPAPRPQGTQARRRPAHRRLSSGSQRDRHECRRTSSAGRLPTPRSEQGASRRRPLAEVTVRHRPSRLARWHKGFGRQVKEPVILDTPSARRGKVVRRGAPTLSQLLLFDESGSETHRRRGRQLASLSGGGDEAFREGGDELFGVAPQTGLDEAVVLAERMRAEIEVLRLPRLEGWWGAASDRKHWRGIGGRTRHQQGGAPLSGGQRALPSQGSPVPSQGSWRESC